MVVFNNGQWGAEKKNHVDFYSRRYLGVNLDNPSLAGDRASVRLRGRDGGPPRGRRSRAAGRVRGAGEGRTTVIEMMVTQELGDPFRRDALSMPVRHLDKYKSYV